MSVFQQLISWQSCLRLLLSIVVLSTVGCVPGSGLAEKLREFSLARLLTGESRSLKTHQVTVGYIPKLTRRKPPLLPPLYVLVLRPQDRRSPPVIHATREAHKEELLRLQGQSALIGFSGLNFEEGLLTIAPPDSVPDLGQLRHVDAGMPHLPNIPKTLFTLDRLSETVQYALTLHFREAGIETEILPFPYPEPLAMESQRAAYALGCTIDELSLYSLRRYQQVQVGSRRLALPVRGPTRAAVSLSLFLYQLPAGRVVWQEQVWDVVHDPPRKGTQHRYRTADATLTLALSRAVGRILPTASFQAALRRPSTHIVRTPVSQKLQLSRSQSSDLLTYLRDKRRSGI